VGEGNSFATWAGTVLPAETPYILVLERADALWEICWDLLRIGYNLPKGWLAGGMRAWRTSARPIETLTEWTVWDLKGRLQSEPGLVVLDVRQPQEWASGHIEGALFITGAELPSRFDEVPRDRPVAVICGSGYRSSVATSLLAHKGFTRVANVLGGMSAWKRAGFPSTQDGEQKQ
jgi:hydroxyacylglutathione hydrolase